MKKRYIYPLIITLCLYLIFIYAGRVYWEIQEEVKWMSPIGLNGVIKLNILAFVFGLLLEWRGIKDILQRKVKMNKLIFIPLILFIIGMIPNHLWIAWFGLGMSGIKMGTVNALVVRESHILLMVLAGVLFVRLVRKEEE